MKKTFPAFLPAILICILVTSCIKEAVTKSNSEVNTRESTKTIFHSSFTSIPAPSGFLGVYAVRDSKSVFIGQANAQSSNVFVHLDYIDVAKTLSAAANSKYLIMPYGPSNYVDSGWAYMISYDKSTNLLTLAPNTNMLAGIVPGSFETRYASYNPKTKEGSFVTRFTGLSDKGNETEISEYFYR